ncbi:hypothetical protein G7Z17_g5798 [Cylindrodendrum hubeiense]|uniref:FAD dependent oxidoreductase domain-containing protein n=1 Tax=Cylindrodendrum hubeiense TaxID=595255 RepID=A0A9P5HEB0_9HYPO|nr:hypothetical protein G7Z17_g5798 [Cylindrodendrum hubeiense]
MSDSSETVVIVGAGIVGSAIAHFLSASSVRRKITVVDRSLDTLVGSTGHAPGFVGQFNESEVLTRLAIDTVQEYTKIPGGFNSVGELEVAYSTLGIERLQSRCRKAASLGLPGEIVSIQRAVELAPDLVKTSDSGAALHFSTDGTANAGRITSHYQESAKNSGVEFLERDITRLLVSKGRVTGVETHQDDTTEQIHADRVILATGIWAQDLCKEFNFPIPVVPVGHPYMHGGVRKPNNRSSPFVRWPEAHVYARDHGDCYGIGTYNHKPVHNKPTNGTAIGNWIPDFDDPLKTAISFLPEATGQEFKSGKSFNGIFSMTPDNMPLAGKVTSVDGLYLAVAVWVTHAAGTAKFITKILNEHEVDQDSRDALEPERFRGQEFSELQESGIKAPLGDLELPRPRERDSMVRNDPASPVQRKTLIDRHHSSCDVQAHLVGVVHGWMTPNTEPATLLVMEFGFLSLKLSRRIKGAKISLSFAEQRRTPHPEIIGIAPEGKFQFYPSTTTEERISGYDSSLAGGSINISAAWERNVISETRHSATIVGSTRSGQDWGADDGVTWTIIENSTLRSGVPSRFRAAILLKRRGHESFSADINIETDVSGFSFRGLQDSLLENEDDPIIFDPGAPPMWANESPVDLQQLGSVDLSSFFDIAILESPTVEYIQRNEAREREVRQEVEKLIELGQGTVEEESHSESWFVDLWGAKSSGDTWESLPQSLSEKDLNKARRSSKNGLTSVNELADLLSQPPVKMLSNVPGSPSQISGVIQADKDVEFSHIFSAVPKLIDRHGHHQILLPLQLFKTHYETTSRAFNSILKDVTEVDSKLLQNLEAESKVRESSQLYRELSMKLHKCSMRLAELDRRRRFEEELGTSLQQDLQNDTQLKLVVNLYASMSKSRDSDIEGLPGKIESQRNVLYNLIAQHDSFLQAKLARESLRDSKAMKTLSILTILFLPGAFVATVFSTEMFEFKSKGQEIWIYFVIVVPLTAVLMVGWVLWLSNTPDTADEELGRAIRREMTMDPSKGKQD